MNEELKEYFKNMFIDIDKNIILDDDQINAIINDDDYVLILAGAGTGKTTTMVGKVKYLVDIKKIDPSKILVISYAKKAVQGLQTLIVDKFGINADVATFHSLAYKYVRKIFKNRKCTIVDFNEREEIFKDYMNHLFETNRIKDLLDTFNSNTLYDSRFFYAKFFRENYLNYNSYDKLFEDYKKYKLEEAHKIGIDTVIEDWITKKLHSDDAIITIKGELVKSVGEAVIANYLYVHGIDYSYEEVYSEIVEDRKVYKPDFTLDLAGEKVYVEYFGLDDDKYDEIKRKKIDMHYRHRNKFIYINRGDKYNIEQQLNFWLKKLGFIYRNRTSEEIYNIILDNNKLSMIYKVKNLFFNSITQIKESADRDHYLDVVRNYLNTLVPYERENCMKQFEFINDFYVFYSNKLFGSDIYRFDYSDLMHYANKYIASKKFLNNLNYEYIIIDEYQDISDFEYDLARKTSNKSKSKVFAVGDDWQSIYSFRGSNINYITKFNKYFDKATVLSIKCTYRNSQELVDIAGEFIRKNQNQIDKNLVSLKNLPKPVHFIQFDDKIGDTIDETAEYSVLKKLIIKIHKLYPDHKILILARENKTIDNCFKFDKDFIDDLGTKIKLGSIDDVDIDGMTIHKSKGLTYDEVIIIGMNDDFPSDRHFKYWLIDLFSPVKLNESIEFAEERRIFYVALTRTKNNVFILANKNAKNRSRFVDELFNIEKEKNLIS